MVLIPARTASFVISAVSRSFAVATMILSCNSETSLVSTHHLQKNFVIQRDDVVFAFPDFFKKRFEIEIDLLFVEDTQTFRNDD